MILQIEYGRHVLEHASEKVEEWRRDYNVNRQNSALGNVIPKEYALQKQLLETAFTVVLEANNEDLQKIKLT